LYIFSIGTLSASRHSARGGTFSTTTGASTGSKKSGGGKDKSSDDRASSKQQQQASLAHVSPISEIQGHLSSFFFFFQVK
jgi:hypothetical protein